MSNHLISRVLFAIASLALTSANTLATGTITNGNASFALIGPPAFSTNNGDCTLLTDTGAPDQGTKYTWYYRTTGNNINRYMSSLDTPSETYVGDTSTITYNNAGPGVAGQERFDAVIVTKIIDGANPNQVRVTATCTFTSHATTTQTYQVFNLIDLDLSGGGANPGTDDSATFDPATFNVLQTEASTVNFANIQAVNPTRWQFGSGSALRTLLTGGSGNLSNATAPVVGQDIGVAFQWTLTLTPGQQVVLNTAFAINMAANCTAPGITQSPTSITTCPSGAPMFNAAASGTSPGLQWQWRPQGSPNWVNIVNGVNLNPNTSQPAFTGAGATSSSVTLTNSVGVSQAVSGGRREIQAVASNACGSLPTTTAVWTICPGDFDCSGGSPTVADIFAFLSAWFAGSASADFDGSGGTPAVADIFSFLSLWFMGC